MLLSSTPPEPLDPEDVPVPPRLALLPLLPLDLDPDIENGLADVGLRLRCSMPHGRALSREVEAYTLEAAQARATMRPLAPRGGA